MIWSRKPNPSPKPRELERKVQAWGNRVAQSMEQSPDKTLQESQDILKWSLRKTGPDSPFTIKAMNEVANQLSRQNRVTEETALREQIVDGLRKNVGSEDEATLKAEFTLATCLIALERPEEADPLLTHVVAGRSLTLGEDDPQTLGAMAWSASVAKKLGRLAGGSRTAGEGGRRVRGPGGRRERPGPVGAAQFGVHLDRARPTRRRPSPGAHRPPGAPALPGAR